MESTQDPMHWWAERVRHSTQHLVQTLNDELREELAEVPFPITRCIHNCAVFELIRMLNTKGTPEPEEENDLAQFIDLLARERYMFLALCDRLAQWRPKEGKHEGNCEGIVPFRKNSRLN